MSVNTSINIAHYLNIQSLLIEKHLDALLSFCSSPYQHLFEAARYSVLGAGKRLRPILALATAETLGGSQETVLSASCALELVHAYSLIHDDLPCMDDDDYRRGKLTVHKQYSEGHAVLTGDYLLTYAFEILTNDPLLSPEKKVRLISTLAKRSGGNGMIGGQVMDLAFEGKKIDLKTLQSLHQKKTGALITAAIEFGGIIADATENQMRFLLQFGENIGLAFQIVDDILDVTSSEVKHGRQIASDLINEKSTYVSLLGLEKSKTCAKECYEKAVNALEQLPCQSPLLINLADFIINRHY